jgi:hypothetical protein
MCMRTGVRSAAATAVTVAVTVVIVTVTRCRHVRKSPDRVMKLVESPGLCRTLLSR